MPYLTSCLPLDSEQTITPEPELVLSVELSRCPAIARDKPRFPTMWMHIGCQTLPGVGTLFKAGWVIASGLKFHLPEGQSAALRAHVFVFELHPRQQLVDRGTTETKNLRRSCFVSA